MPTKRTPLSRLRKPVITEEMVSLFRTGLEILEQGADQRWEEVGGRRGEYLDLDLRLNIVLLQQAWHAVSVLDHPMPRYMERLASRGDWPTSVRLRQALAGRATPHEAGRLILNPARFSASLRWRRRCPLQPEW